ncbi:PQQ-binding-like beta-propeller repeat protein [Botrimarina sp.]|uniref:outer membrane protein assembly factor BamB family protein n=1 Tax=Botrimarina sp. TaxID=2795802 RepID=UPI0032EDAC42
MNALRLLPFVLLLAPAGAAVGDWPQFRGPAGNGVADGVEPPPESWSESGAVDWTADVPGEGWSAPVVAGDNVLLTAAVPTEADAYRFEVICYALQDGAERWRRVAFEQTPREPKHGDNTFASETPAADDERVFAYFGMNGLVCYTLGGDLVWKKDLGAYPMDNDWGTSSSPALADGRLFLQIDNEQESFLVALDAATGDELWRAQRPNERSNWSSPIVWKNSRGTEVVAGGKTVRSYDAASGREIWSMEIGGRSSASPSAVGDVLYVGSENRTQRGGTPGGLFAVGAGASGEIDVTDPDAAAQGLVWANTSGAVGIASPLVYHGQIYVPERRGGVLRAHDAQTGEETFRTRLPGGGVFWASPIAIGDRVYVTDERGKTFVLAPGPEREILQTSALPGRFWSTPAVADGALLFRSQDKLYCVRTP